MTLPDLLTRVIAGDVYISCSKELFADVALNL